MRKPCLYFRELTRYNTCTMVVSPRYTAHDDTHLWAEPNCVCPTTGDVGCLITLWVPAPLRGQGLGRQLLRAVCRDADESGTVLWLSVEPGDGDVERLIATYQRRGFQLVPPYVHPLMVRRPRPPLP